MRTKNAAPITRAESAHMAEIKGMPCAVCQAPAPSEAHHVRQGRHFCVVPLCADCHRGSLNGWHGQKTMWRIHRMDELDALNETLRRLLA